VIQVQDLDALAVGPFAGGDHGAAIKAPPTYVRRDRAPVAAMIHR
jgi:hypothetical protein